MVEEPQQDGTARVVLSGPATIREADAVYAQLVAALQRDADVEIDCTDVSEADLTLVQMLLAARKSADAAGHALVLAGTSGGALQDALRRGGFVSGDAETVREDEKFWLSRRENK